MMTLQLRFQAVMWTHHSGTNGRFHSFTFNRWISPSLVVCVEWIESNSVDAVNIRTHWLVHGRGISCSKFNYSILLKFLPLGNINAERLVFLFLFVSFVEYFAISHPPPPTFDEHFHRTFLGYFDELMPTKNLFELVFAHNNGKTTIKSIFTLQIIMMHLQS